MRSLKALLDDASRMCGSDAALARKIGAKGHHPNEWRSGKRTITPRTVGLLCDVAGVDPEEARELAAQAVIDAETNDHRDALHRAFFRAAAWGGVALVTALATLPAKDVQAATDDAGKCNRLYIMSTVRRALRWLRRAAQEPLQALKFA